MKAAPALAVAAALALAPAAARAQAGGVPAYEPPPPVTITRDGEKLTPEAKFGEANGEDKTAAMLANFASAYERNGKPRLALYWNRQLSETLNEWYSPTRIVNRDENTSTMSGELTLNQSGSRQTTMEIQKRVRDDVRAQPDESFVWEFQDGFLNPFLDAGVQVIDRAAMMRLTGADMDGTAERIVEMKALQGKADYLMEVLVAGNDRSRTGYELRARILEVKSGRIVAYVNSKGLKSWNPAQPSAIITTDGQIIDPDDEDEDAFGPQGEEKVRIGKDGIQFRRKPPKLEKIARNLAYNTMDGLMKQWK